jgi:hypothetical protein
MCNPTITVVIGVAMGAVMSLQDNKERAERNGKASERSNANI